MTGPERERVLRDLAEIETAAGILRRMIDWDTAGDAKVLAGRLLSLAGEVAITCDPGHHEGHFEVVVQFEPGGEFSNSVSRSWPDAASAGEAARKVQETGTFHCVRATQVITAWFTPEEAR